MLYTFIFLLFKNNTIYIIHNILTANKQLPVSCKTVLLTGQRSIARYRTVGRWPYFHWFNKSRDIDVTMPRRHPDSRTWHLMDMWLERVNMKKLKKMKVYNETVIDCFFGQQKFCLNLKKSAASGNRSVFGSNKTAIVLEPSQ